MSDPRCRLCGYPKSEHGSLAWALHAEGKDSGGPPYVEVGTPPPDWRALAEQMAEALRNACDSWEEAAQYKGDYLREKHGDAEEIAAARAKLAAFDAAKK